MASPAHIRSDNGPEFTAALIRLWLGALQVQTLFIEPGSPWENGYVESFNGKLRDELLDREIFYTLTEAKILLERWRRQYTHSAAAQCAGLSTPSAQGGHADTHCRVDHEPSSLIRLGTTTGGRSNGSRPSLCGKGLEWGLSDDR